VGQAHGGLGALRQRGGGAHFLGDGVGHVAVALLVLDDDALEQVNALLDRGQGEGGERLAGGLGGLVDMLGRAQRDLAADLFIGRVDDVERRDAGGLDPLAVDVEFRVVAHHRLSLRTAERPLQTLV
jgi:hypothetical protein